MVYITVENQYKICQKTLDGKCAEWISSRLNADIMTIQEAKKMKMDFYDKYDAIVYGGWAMAGSVVSSKWFLQKTTGWKNKKLALFCVGASPEANPDIEEPLGKLLTDEQKQYIKVFYCQGGIDYSKMKLPSKLAMKAFASALSRKKNADSKEKAMAEMISHSYDISDEKYIVPIIQYMEG